MAKVMVSLPDELLERIDGEAKRRGSSRSALLRAGVLRELERPSAATIDAALERARAATGGVGGVDIAKLVRRDREERDRRDRSR